MRVRTATIVDLDRCQGLDGSYATSHVWQVNESVEPNRISLALQQVKLPRSLQIDYSLDRQNLLEDWKCRECFLLAEEALSVAGFLDMTVEREGWQGWIRHLVIHRPFRRQGVASALLQGAESWARGSELTSMTAILQTKNDPAIRLFMSRGYAFRGFIDRYFSNGDMAMLYTREL